MKSEYIPLHKINNIPPFVGGRLLYMQKVSMNKVHLPQEFVDFIPAVEEILQPLTKDNVCYVTIDEKVVNNHTHRRAGIHCDFNWYEGKGWNDGGNGLWIRTNGIGSHGDSGGGTHNCAYDTKGGMLLVSNYPACKVWRGEFFGEIGEGGDCQNINVSHMETEVVPENKLYYLNALGIHESLHIDKQVNRTLIRINFHPEYEFKIA